MREGEGVDLIRLAHHENSVVVRVRGRRDRGELDAEITIEFDSQFTVPAS